MNSQSHYHLSFNPRNRQAPRGEKIARYIPQYRSNPALLPPWKQPVPTEPPYDPADQPSNKPTPYAETKLYNMPQSFNESGYLSNSSSMSASRRDEQQRKRQQERKKEDIMKRVRELQDKVLPMVDRQEATQEENCEVGWQSRVEMKVMRLQTCLDSIRKEWEIEMERKLMQVEAMIENRYEQLVARNPR